MIKTNFQNPIIVKNKMITIHQIINSKYLLKLNYIIILPKK